MPHNAKNKYNSDMTERDPELRDFDEEGTGDPEAYDGEAVRFYPYDASEFDASDDFEFVQEDDDA